MRSPLKDAMNSCKLCNEAIRSSYVASTKLTHQRVCCMVSYVTKLAWELVSELTVVNSDLLAVKLN